MRQHNPDRYDRVSIAFHWITAIIVVVAFILGPGGFGRLMRSGVDPATRSDIVWHETLGVAVFALTVLRLLWVAARSGVPSFNMAPWMHHLSRLVHGLLWVLLMALPLTALLALGSERHPLTLLGGFRVNDLSFLVPSFLSGLADWGDVHGFLGDAIVWLAGLHALAALYHHFRLKDKVLVSMVP